MVRRVMATVLSMALLLGGAPSTAVVAAPAVSQNDAIARVPPRLSHVQGDVSFWRPGAQDWAPAQLNTPLAPGDELYTSHEANLELQVGGRAFVRAWGDTQLGLANQEPDFLQIKVTTGHLSLDLRGIDAGDTVEIDTPHAAFTVARPGYYRVDTTPERTSFITRRGGRATMTPPSGQAVAISASEEVVLEGAPMPTAQSYIAPELDVWDRWNYARTDDLLDAVSARYVPANVYGVDDLDQYGTWRVVQTYGSVWVPEAVPVGWVPYSTGKWVWDPSYGWTWIDTAPWGWAPYHYGRWVFVEGFWAWAPGPIVVRPVYAPALVAFFRAPGVRVDVTAGGPFVSWVALGWGEPVIPWWGRPGFVGRPWWAGWGGPRVVNNVVVNQTTVVNVNHITVYRNSSVEHAVVAVRQDGFGRRPVHETRLTHVDVRRLQPVRGAPNVKPDAESFVVTSGPARRPPEAALSPRVVATRPPARHAVAPGGSDKDHTPGPNIPAPRVVTPSRSTPAQPSAVPARPPFGASSVERPRPSRPSRGEPMQRPEGPPAASAPSPMPPPSPRERARSAEPRPLPPTPSVPAMPSAPAAPSVPATPSAPPRPSVPATSSLPPTPSAPPTSSRPPSSAVPLPPAERPPASARPSSVPPSSSAPPQSPARRSPVAPPSSSAPPPAARPSLSVPPSSSGQPAAADRALPSSPSSSAPPTSSVERGESNRPATRPLPGQPANRLFPGRGEPHVKEQAGRGGGTHTGPAQEPGKERNQR